MIAALATGLLGQLEGLTSLSSGIAGASGLFSGSGNASFRAAPALPGPQNGRAALLPTLSDQLQTLLLQQQSQQTGAPGAIQIDDLAGASAVG